jgi:hypothetical protein
MSIPNHVLVYIWAVSITVSPVERLIEEVNMLAKTFCNGSIAPRVAGLVHSEIEMPIAPTTSRNKLAQRMILELSDHCDGMV